MIIFIYYLFHNLSLHFPSGWLPPGPSGKMVLVFESVSGTTIGVCGLEEREDLVTSLLPSILSPVFLLHKV